MENKTIFYEEFYISIIMGHSGHKFNPHNLKKLEYIERFQEEPIDILLPLIEIENKKNIVDLGCGPGYYTFHFAHYSSEYAKIYALDVSQLMIDRLIENIESGNIFKPFNNIEKKKIFPKLIEEDIFPFEDNSIDLFFNSKVFHEMEDINRFMKEISRVLQKGGLFFTMDWRKIEMDKGPPLAHRVKMEDAIDIISKFNMEIADSGIIYENLYYIKAKKK